MTSETMISQHFTTDPQQYLEGSLSISLWSPFNGHIVHNFPLPLWCSMLVFVRRNSTWRFNFKNTFEKIRKINRSTAMAPHVWIDCKSRAIFGGVYGSFKHKIWLHSVVYDVWIERRRNSIEIEKEKTLLENVARGELRCWLLILS